VTRPRPSSSSRRTAKTADLFTQGLWQNQLTPLFLAFLLAGLYFFVKDTDLKARIVILSWIIIPQCIMLFMAHWKSARYLMPVQPAYALISAFAVGRLLAGRRGTVIVVVLCLVGVAQLYDMVYGSMMGRIGYGRYNYFNMTGDPNIHWSRRSRNSAALGAIAERLETALAKQKVLTPKEQYFAMSVEQEKWGWLWTALDGYVSHLSYHGWNLSLVNYRVGLISMMTGEPKFFDTLGRLDFIIYHVSDDEPFIDLKNGGLFSLFAKAASDATDYEKNCLQRAAVPRTQDSIASFRKACDDTMDDFVLEGMIFKDAERSIYLYRRMKQDGQ
jgi:hypothetical protein